jgi:hypothetical protein
MNRSCSFSIHHAMRCPLTPTLSPVGRGSMCARPHCQKLVHLYRSGGRGSCRASTLASCARPPRQKLIFFPLLFEEGAGGGVSHLTNCESQKHPTLTLPSVRGGDRCARPRCQKLVFPSPHGGEGPSVRGHLIVYRGTPLPHLPESEVLTEPVHYCHARAHPARSCRTSGRSFRVTTSVPQKVDAASLPRRRRLGLMRERLHRRTR